MTDRGDRGTPASSAWRRASQYLTIPLGGLAPAHREHPPLVRLWRRHGPLVVTAAGCLIAAAGVLVASLPRAIPAYADAAHLHVGGLTLDRAPASPRPGYALYRGSAAILLSGTGPRARAAGAAAVAGLSAAGTCAPAPAPPGQIADRCTFTLGGVRLTSRDVFDPQAITWRRTYSDGLVAQFQAPGAAGAVPIPLPLGR